MELRADGKRRVMKCVARQKGKTRDRIRNGFKQGKKDNIKPLEFQKDNK